MEYKFRDIEQKWQKTWTEQEVYKVPNDTTKPKYYVLDMFPYPSGAGLHVGHPLGYIASDIFARYKRLKGFNVLHPMGYDAFGLPAEQYAIEHGVHPAVSTAKNIKTFRSQLDKIGFCFDWSREVNTSQPGYYKWTQWIFLQLFKSWYNRLNDKAEPIDQLVAIFEDNGNRDHPIPDNNFQIPDYPHVTFTAEAWNSFPEKTKQAILMEYRLAYCGVGEVNWCEALGTVLANDEVVNGVSERGGYPVVKKKLRQWYLRITEYADRLLKGLETVDFSDAMKEMQSNWIGKSSGAEMDFAIAGHQDDVLRVYTTRPDTIFGVDFMVIAPEHELVERITTTEQKKQVEEYIAYVKSRSERERMAEKKISGVFTGAYAVNPFDGKQIPVWISEYVLAGYGTGAIMAVPSGDERDHKFARYFNLPITNIIGDAYNGEEANPTKDVKLSNSGFLDGMVMRDAIDVVINKLEEMGIGKRHVNYKMRDAAFSRQRYWGEPFPIKWIDGIAYPLEENELPLELPFVESYKPGPEGEGPLANIPEWTNRHLETNTMPGYAGSSWYFLRYMDPHNEQTFCDKKWSDYWRQVDLYVGGTEHAVGHLLYSRMWTKALYDLGYLSFDEPFKKLLNQGMIQGSSRFVYRVHGTNQFVSAGLKDQYETDDLHVDVTIVDGVELDMEAFKSLKPEYAEATFILENGKYICGSEVEKMSKSKVNTVNPDHIVERYGADTFRMYEMFLGPVEMSKPWDMKGIEGVHRFLKKLWRLFFDEQKGNLVTTGKATAEELKVLHRTIRKIEEDTERFSYNTAVSAFMVCVNELTDLKCHKQEILEPLLVLLTPYAPHISEELWHQVGHSTTILDAAFPKFEPKYVMETTKEYPVSINGKMRTQIVLDLNATQEEVQQIVLDNPVIQKWMEGKVLKKFIFVKGKMVNVVI
ncbi:leucine--tRNA ligase [Flavisolibacter ginsengisoli]|jgi:leucyl-tRNA synthetase|uniref:Leucine--tRNA ligase n=1 Tax=Flavisolibacter ginsengisoli DSM 18119 TaxID=1121884 RepID=A0A1M5DE22_9BACT|nr:leucine--tRNA ligase [Flavisolibacter ginsengisoli]SHF65303.1 leucyl-tRNA synthetase [Flavisolibacter ginsengisoli DSM 18119]